MKQLIACIKQSIITLLILVGSTFLWIPAVQAAAPSGGGTDCTTITDPDDRAACESAAAAAAARQKSLCDGAGAAGVENCGDSTKSTESFKNIIGTIINILSVIVGAVSVIMIIIGGFRYVVSAGDSNAMSGAKNTILYAVVGLVIVLFAQIIVAFVIDRATAF